MDSKNLNKIVECMEKIEPFPTKFNNNELDIDTYNWYVDKFRMFEEDGCVLAINPYLSKLVREKKTNMYTIVQIQKVAVDIITRS